MGCEGCKGVNAIYVDAQLEKDGKPAGTANVPICPYFFLHKGELEEAGERAYYEAEGIAISSYRCLLANGKSKHAKNFKEFEKAVQASMAAT